MENSTRRAAANVAGRANVAASRLPLSDRDAAERFCDAVSQFSAGDLARAAHRTKSAAKGWKDASRAPGLASAINMARALPTVRDWICAEIGHGTAANSQIAVLREMVADEVRAIVKKPPAPSADPDYDPRAAVRDLFHGKRA